MNALMTQNQQLLDRLNAKDTTTTPATVDIKPRKRKAPEFYHTDHTYFARIEKQVCVVENVQDEVGGRNPEKFMRNTGIKVFRICPGFQIFFPQFFNERP